MASSSAHKSSGEDGDLNELMNQLGIQDTDLDDVVFEEIVDKLAEAVRWLAVVKVCTEKRYSQAAFFRSMRPPGIFPTKPGFALWRVFCSRLNFVAWRSGNELWRGAHGISGGTLS